jgi:hypothetical protein
MVKQKECKNTRMSKELNASVQGAPKKKGEEGSASVQGKEELQREKSKEKFKNAEFLGAGRSERAKSPGQKVHQ